VSRTKTLVVGVGNIFLGDDGFGVEVVRRLSMMDLPAHVRVADYGIRGMHLAHDLAGAGYPLTIMVDATQRGDEPGTIYVVELDQSTVDLALLDAHGMQPDAVLGLVRVLGGDPGRVLLVGCEPAELGHGMSLSPPVERAVDVAVTIVRDLVTRYPFESDEELACALASLVK
jgi:hydrogenase maturation protease